MSTLWLPERKKRGMIPRTVAHGRIPSWAYKEINPPQKDIEVAVEMLDEETQGDNQCFSAQKYVPANTWYRLKEAVVNAFWSILCRLLLLL